MNVKVARQSGKCRTVGHLAFIDSVGEEVAVEFARELERVEKREELDKQEDPST